MPQANIIDMSDAFDAGGESISDLFSRVEEGFYVPLYQREYTWEEDNINQLMDDLCSGVKSWANDPSAVTFLGTVILSQLDDPKQAIKPSETKAIPTAVRLVVDGQQRIATIALLAIELREWILLVAKHLPETEAFDPFHTHKVKLVSDLSNLYAMDLKRGEPHQKPKIIRAEVDRWTFDGADNNYASAIAHYLAVYIRTLKAPDALASITNRRVIGNIKFINTWLKKIARAHVPETDLFDQYPVGNQVTIDRIQEPIWGYSDPEISKLLSQHIVDDSKPEYHALSLFSLFLAAHYFLKRCGINRLKPKNQDWGFDMFQALNATGTPLTAMETFLPHVMQAEAAGGKKWSASPSKTHWDEIDRLFESTTTNEQKSTITNDLLGTFALCYDGEKLANKFSEQRKWLERHYNGFNSLKEKQEFVSKLAEVSKFYYFAWSMRDPPEPNIVYGLEGHAEKALGSGLIAFLADANSKLSAPILARYYSQALKDNQKSGEFIAAAKACAAFFTLWRSSNSTSGLDDVYRRFMKSAKAPIAVGVHSWIAHPADIVVADLKAYFTAVLENKKVRKKKDWMQEAKQLLRYTEVKTICRFMLFLAAHDSIPDKAAPGLGKHGKAGSCEMLTAERWGLRDFKTIEHVAPQQPPDESQWDKVIYDHDSEQTVGNLMLLSDDLNKHAANKSWKVKYLHYCYVGEKDPEKAAALEAQAKKEGIALSNKAIKVLQKTKYQCHVEPVLQIGLGGAWDDAFIDKRTERILDLAWDTLDAWLQ